VLLAVSRILPTRVERSLLKSASGTSNFIGVLDRMSTKLQSKLRKFVSAKTKLLKELQSERVVDDSAHT